MLKKIPGLSNDDYFGFRDILKDFLGALHDLKIPAKQIVLRLNQTGETQAAPVFVGYVLDHDLVIQDQERNFPDPGLHRFGDTVRSYMYEDCLNRFLRREVDLFVERDWKVDFNRRLPEEKAQSATRGVNYLLITGIIVDDDSERQCVGVLGVGFLNKPDHKASIDETKKRINEWIDPHLVTYLKDRYQLGGPSLPIGHQSNPVSALNDKIDHLQREINELKSRVDRLTLTRKFFTS